MTNNLVVAGTLNGGGNFTVSNSFMVTSTGIISSQTSYLTVGDGSQANIVSVNGSILVQSMTFNAIEVYFGPKSDVSVSGVSRPASIGDGSLTGVYAAGGTYGGSGGCYIALYVGTPYGSFMYPVSQGGKGAGSGSMFYVQYYFSFIN